MPKSKNQRSKKTATIPLLLATLPALILGAVGISYLRHEAVIAEDELKRSADRYARQISQRLRVAYEDYLQSEEMELRAVMPESIRQFSIPNGGSSSADREAYEVYQSLVNAPTVDLEALTKKLPTFREVRTPAGVPLFPIAQLKAAQWHFAEKNSDSGIVMLGGLLQSVVIDHPSAISEPLLQRVELIAAAEDLREKIDLKKWRAAFRAKSGTREVLFRNRDYLDRFGSRYPWFEHDGERCIRIFLPDGKVVVLSKTELETLAGTALSQTLQDALLFRYPLAFRLQFEREAIVPSPLNDMEVREAWFRENGFDAIAHNQNGKELISTGTTTPFLVRVSAANYETFKQSVRKRIFQQGSFLAIVMGCLGFGIFRTWRTIEAQRALAERQSNLISSISHELRSPVAGIRLMAERLSAKGSERESREKYTRLIGKESGRLSALIENILDAGSIADGRKAYQFEWTNLSGLVEDTVERMRPLADSEGKKIKLQIDHPDLSAEVDPVAMQQALGNLIDNALKFSPDGETVFVRLDSESDEETISLAVSDQGIGIAEEDQASVFDLFFRAGSELQRETTGTGLGLHLVQHIVEGHGGSIHIESVLGEGSAFEMDFPREQNAGEPNQ